jgi:hypothetical protein
MPIAAPGHGACPEQPAEGNFKYFKYFKYILYFPFNLFCINFNFVFFLMNYFYVSCCCFPLAFGEWEGKSIPRECRRRCNGNGNGSDGTRKRRRAFDGLVVVDGRWTMGRGHGKGSGRRNAD